MQERKMESITRTIDFGELGEIDCLVYFEYTPAQQGSVDGPPEDCCPSYEAEVEVDSVFANGGSGKSINITSLSDWKWLADWILENPEECDE